MRAKLLAAVAATATLISAPAGAYEMPYDPYRWCAVYGAVLGGATNCGFITLEQCRQTIAGLGGFCNPNPFYNPHPAKQKRRRHSLGAD
jgi:hypothetical protein